MPTIELQYKQTKFEGNPSQPKQKDGVTTASVASSPGRLYTATFAGRLRTLNRVGVNASGQDVYRDFEGPN